MALSIASLDGKNQILHNRETPIQPHPEVNIPCTRQKLEQLSSYGIQKLKFIRCDKIRSFTRNSDIRYSIVVTTTPNFQVIFEFTCTRTDDSLIQCVDSTLVLDTALVVDTVKYEIVKKSINFNLRRTPIRNINFNAEEFKKEAYETMAKELEHWPLGAKGRQELIEFAWKKVCDVAQLVPTNHNVLHLCFNTILKHNHLYEQILPGNCSICLEEYSKLTYPLKYLSCSHVFHNHCINKWLEKCSYENRHCPLCRSHID